MSKPKKKGLEQGLAVVPAPPSQTEVPKASAAAFGAKGTKQRREERGERISIYMPVDIAGRLRVQCAIQRRSISDAITESVGRWLEAQEENGG